MSIDLSAAIDTDIQAVFDAYAKGQAVDPEVARRVREHADRMREEMFRKHGYLNIAVDLIREIRESQ